MITEWGGFQGRKGLTFSSIGKVKAEVGYNSSLSQSQERSDKLVREESDPEGNCRLLQVTVS